MEMGRPLGSLILLAKVFWTVVAWLVSQRIHNDICKMYVVSLCIPISLEIITNISLSILECLCRFPDMALIRFIFQLHRLFELISRDFFTLSTISLFLMTISVSRKGTAIHKTTAQRLFLCLLVCVSLANTVLLIYPSLSSLHFNTISTIVDVINIAFASLTAYTFAALFICLCLCSSSSTPDGVAATRRMKWILPYIILLPPVASVELLPREYRIVASSLVDSVAPILYLAFALLLLPPYRQSLFRCGPPPEKSVHPVSKVATPNAKDGNYTSVKNGVKQPIPFTTNTTPIYSYLQPIGDIPNSDIASTTQGISQSMYGNVVSVPTPLSVPPLHQQMTSSFPSQHHNLLQGNMLVVPAAVYFAHQSPNSAYNPPMFHTVPSPRIE